MTTALGDETAVVMNRGSDNYWEDTYWDQGTVGTVVGAPGDFRDGWTLVQPLNGSGSRTMPTDALTPVADIVEALASLPWSPPSAFARLLAEEEEIERTLRAADDNLAYACDVDAMIGAEQEAMDRAGETARLAAEEAERERQEEEARQLRALASTISARVAMAVETERERIAEAVLSFDQGCDEGKRQFLQYAELPYEPRMVRLSFSGTVIMSEDDWQGEYYGERWRVANAITEGDIELEGIDVTGWEYDDE